MTRRRSIPWIHRWSRPLIGAIAGLGILNTGYLTLSKWFSAPVACPTSGCEQVLQSRYAFPFGVQWLPLSLFGLLAYIAIALFALAPLAVNAENNKSLRTNLEKNTWTLLFAGTMAMLLFSGYLMYIMFSEFVSRYGAGGICYFCIFSAITATAVFVLTLVGRDWDDRGQLLFLGTIVTVVTLIATLGIYAPRGDIGNAGVIADGQGKPVFLVDNTSGPAELGLAQHLKQSGAKMYASFTCPHCCEQKELFGKEAINELPYVECNPYGKDPQTDACEKIGEAVKQKTGQEFGFPTWQVNGQFLVGRQKLTDLAKASGYTGPQNFKNADKQCRLP
jgi:uncharacterized membrane protein